MAFRVKRSCTDWFTGTRPEIEENNGDFIVDTDGAPFVRMCPISRTPFAKRDTHYSDIFDYVAGKIRTYARPCCVKIRVNAELKRADFNMILQC